MISMIFKYGLIRNNDHFNIYVISFRCFIEYINDKDVCVALGGAVFHARHDIIFSL